MKNSGAARWMMLLIATLLISGCYKNYGLCYSEYEHIGEEGWEPMRILGFSPSPADTLSAEKDRFKVLITLRYTDECRVADLPVMITEQDDEGEIASEVCNISLRDKSGKASGNKGLVFYELVDTLHSNYKLPQNYWIELASLAPAEYSRGISEIGVELIREYSHGE